MSKENQVLKNNIENITKTTEDEMHSMDEEIATALIENIKNMNKMLRALKNNYPQTSAIS